jgi:hypothetical protein
VRVDVQKYGVSTAVATPTVQASFDVGKTWTPVKLTLRGGHWTAPITYPETATSVSFKATTHDSDGNSVTQTTIRAYGVHR